VAYSVWLGDVHLFAPGGLPLADADVALRWAAGYSRRAHADVTVCHRAEVIATYRRGERLGDGPLPAGAEPRVLDTRPVRPRSLTLPRRA
jgi:hypothetical protein